MIRTISIPYYTSSMDLHVEEKNLKTVITAKTEDYVPEKSPKELIEDALEHPIGTPKLSEFPARFPQPVSWNTTRSTKIWYVLPEPSMYSSS